MTWYCLMSSRQTLYPLFLRMMVTQSLLHISNYYGKIRKLPNLWERINIWEILLQILNYSSSLDLLQTIWALFFSKYSSFSHRSFSNSDIFYPNMYFSEISFKVTWLRSQFPYLLFKIGYPSVERIQASCCMFFLGKQSSSKPSRIS